MWAHNIMLVVEIILIPLMIEEFFDSEIIPWNSIISNLSRSCKIVHEEPWRNEILFPFPYFKSRDVQIFNSSAFPWEYQMTSDLNRPRKYIAE
jgi:hypothetical protein